MAFVRHPDGARLLANLRQVILGKDEVLILVLVGLIAGHILMEDVGVGGRRWPAPWPGRSPSTSSGCSSPTTSCPPTSWAAPMLRPADGTFEFRPGPSSPRCAAGGWDQPGLAAHAVGAAGGHERGAGDAGRGDRALPAPFFVIATAEPHRGGGHLPAAEASSAAS
ncbi:MAG: hypothetical protein R3F43_02980 [bacterium]